MANEQKQQFQCPGDCLKCMPAQRTYCASQHAYSNMKVLDVMMGILTGMKEQVNTMQGEMMEISQKIEAIQNSEGAVFSPDGGSLQHPDLFAVDNTEKDIAQQGSGA